MSTLTLPREVLFTSTEVAKITGVSEVNLKYFHPDDMGCPGHWYVRGADVIYTVAGLERLIAGFAAMQHPVEARNLTVALRQRTETPTKPQWWQRGSMA